jgi:hypothetical protein
MTKNGSTMRSRASVQILVGAGSVASGRLHSICQTMRSSPSVTSGGTTRAAAVDSAGRMRPERLGLGGLSSMTAAGALRAEAAGLASPLSKGMFMRVSDGKASTAGVRRQRA